MTSLIDRNTRLMVQGITGHQGQFHAQAMISFGTKVVAGVTPGKGGGEVSGVPVYDTVRKAVEETDANSSVIFVPAPQAKDAVLEALDAGILLIVVITEHIPTHDTIEFVQYSKLKGAKLIGPNCPGIASPGISKLGIMPNMIFRKGEVGVVSRSGTLTYEVVNSLSEEGIGQSTCVGIGGDPVIGSNFIDVLRLFEEDPDTKEVALIGEIGGTAEEDAAAFIKQKVKKPVFAYVAGLTAPEGKRMGHAGAIIARGRGTAKSKIAALRDVGVTVASVPAELPKLIVDSRKKGSL